jgi:RecB family endonuclease NucS
LFPPSGESLWHRHRNGRSQHFPTSKWQKTHYAWYKSKIKTGEIPVPGISSEANEESRGDQIEAEVEESIEASVSLERDLHSYLATRVSEIESGLTLVENGVECQTEAGRIDLLARDANNYLVVVELKAGKARDNALGQLLGYMGCLPATESNVRGILVASNFDSRVIFAARGLPNVKLVRYQLSFNLEEIS